MKFVSRQASDFLFDHKSFHVRNKKRWETMADISVKAGKNVYKIIREGGFNFDQVTTYVGPAVGPRWLVASGFDMTLFQSGTLGRRRPVLLAGSSAGALRFAAWLQPEATESYRRLMEDYISMSFNRMDTPETILEAIHRVVNNYIDDDAIPFALANSNFRLAIITSRAKGLASSEVEWIQRLGLGFSFLYNAANSSWLHHFFQRVVFYNSPFPPQFCLKKNFRGKAIKLNEANFKHALLASSAIPLVVAGVKNIYGAPNGTYRDGGLMDYHLNQQYAEKKEDVILLFHHQERIIPGWLDKKLQYKKPQPETIENVLMVCPTEKFIQKLPGGKIPDREDFKTFADNPSTRITNWWHAVELSETLGEQFLELIESKKIRDVVEEI